MNKKPRQNNVTWELRQRIIILEKQIELLSKELNRKKGE